MLQVFIPQGICFPGKQEKIDLGSYFSVLWELIKNEKN